MSASIEHPAVSTFVHQEDGIRWMIHRETDPLYLTRGTGGAIHGGLLCDDMGMGKTMQITQLIVRRPVAFTLIVVPVSVSGQWRDVLVRAVVPVSLQLYMCVSRKQVRLCSPVTSSTQSAPQTGFKYGPRIDFSAIRRNSVVIASYGQMMVPLTAEEQARKSSKGSKSFPAVVKRLGTDDGSDDNESNNEDETTATVVTIATIATIATKPQTNIPFPGCVWDRVILDEAHTIKNRKTQTYGSAAKLQMSPTGSRWSVTGTPVQNRLDDIYSLYKFTGVPAALLRKKKTIVSAQWLFARLALRRTVADLTPEQVATIRFPEAYVNHEHNVTYGSEEESEFYRRITGQIMARLARLEHYPDQQEAARCRLELINQLRFLAVHPNIYISCVNHQRPTSPYPLWTDPVSKQNDVVALIKRMAKKGQSFVMFTHFVEELNQYKAAIEDEGFIVYEIHGGQTAAAREREVAMSRRLAGTHRAEIAQLMETFVPGDVAWKIAEYASPLQAMLVHIRAGGAGLNLQHFSNVIMPSPDWNPAMEAQAVGRCHRIGQKHRVNVYRFYIREVQGVLDQIEIYMRAKQETKKAIADAVTATAPIGVPADTPAGVRTIRVGGILPASKTKDNVRVVSLPGCATVTTSTTSTTSTPFAQTLTTTTSTIKNKTTFPIKTKDCKITVTKRID